MNNYAEYAFEPTALSCLGVGAYTYIIHKYTGIASPVRSFIHRHKKKAGF